MAPEDLREGPSRSQQETGALSYTAIREYVHFASHLNAIGSKFPHSEPPRKCRLAHSLNTFVQGSVQCAVFASLALQVLGVSSSLLLFLFSFTIGD